MESKWFLMGGLVGSGLGLFSNDMIYYHLKNKQYGFFYPYEIVNTKSAKKVFIKNAAYDDRDNIMNDYFSYINARVKDSKKAEKE